MVWSSDKFPNALITECSMTLKSVIKKVYVKAFYRYLVENSHADTKKKMEKFNLVRDRN